MKRLSFLLIIVILTAGLRAQAVPHEDVPFLQDYSVKFYNRTGAKLLKAFSDRNGNIQLLSDQGLMAPYDGAFLYPGTIEPDRSYRTLASKKLTGMDVYEDQFVYVDQTAVLSNAWAGSLFAGHELSGTKLFAGGKDFTFLVSDGKSLVLAGKTGPLWKGRSGDAVLGIRYTPESDLFWILGPKTLQTFSPGQKELKTIFEGTGFTAFVCGRLRYEDDYRYR